jgi:hypothetical protein
MTTAGRRAASAKSGDLDANVRCTACGSGPYAFRWLQERELLKRARLASAMAEALRRSHRLKDSICPLGQRT